MRRVEESSVAGNLSADQAAAAVVEEIEAAAGALNTRMAPLVPGCGILVTAAGLLFKAEPSSHGLAEVLTGLAVVSAVGGMWLLTRGVFTYAGRRAIGLAPTVEDIAFARGRLVHKQTSGYRGGLLAGISLTSLLLGILLGVHLELGLG